MKKDRFDLESEIMAAWGTVEDIDLIFHNTDNLNLSAKDCDNLQNQLLGLRSIAELRFQKLFKTFEYMVHSGQCSGTMVNIAPSGELPIWVKEEDAR